MYKEKNLVVKPKYIQNYRDKYPLISKESIIDFNKIEQGDIINLIDNRGKFIAKGYAGVQNKGSGWTLSYNKNEEINKNFFRNKIQQAIEHRENFYKDTQTTTAFRVFNGEGDGVGGLTIDYFDGFYLVTWYSLGIYKFRDNIIEVLKEIVDYKGIYQKRRFDAKGQYLESQNDFICGKEADAPIIVKENGVNFAIYLDDGAMVGIFLDQRDVRKTIHDKYSNNKTMLNTFSYTGAFSVFSSLGGAKSTTSVDLANRSRAKTTEQFRVNNIDLENQNIIVEDIFNYFKYAVRKKLQFDLVVVDPPSFARSKKHIFSASKDYVKLLKDVIAITSNNGVIVASTNSANFDIKVFKDFIAKAFKELNIKYKIEENFSLPKDFKVNDNFKEGNYLKVLFVRKIV